MRRILPRIKHATATLLVTLVVAAVGHATFYHAAALAADQPARIVAIGDIHGDYDNFIAVLQEAGVIDQRRRWRGGNTRLVQVGDIPDRGPDTRKIVTFLVKLEKSARRAGGAVHALIGNHESMNLQGDLRYVHPGEYEAFADRGSARLRDRYFEATVEHIRQNRPEEQWPVFDDSYREAWNRKFPLGYVEHRRAWAPDGEIGRWVLQHDAVLQLDTTLFVHGGISPAYAGMPIAEINTRVRTELASGKAGVDAIVNAPDGPLWYRGNAVQAETADNEAALDAMLAQYGAERIVIAHTPLLGTVLPRFGGKVLLVDVGMSAYYGGARAALVIDGDSRYVLQNGRRFDLPVSSDGVIDYLKSVAPLVPKPDAVNRYICKLDPARGDYCVPPTEEAIPDAA